ncbi:adenylyltransferase/cytidyltransferase family protein [Listeria booriae]|uniref:Adenylyltransferase/cytidyltransferase family protein n=1 Tax=Listeria booriae TaxID=1552123 RepID=A0A7X0TMX4_9LIST|nr:adenylyltransferase/cytidyltransferase family protein [Listeria booriae]MBC1233467.1 adenylyltransferase/cytidyltransferase family protein [Listeria booriae]MBC1245787.1 adenylyltransferase/cytidyltransferase family protein [Listeria booriae]MBC1285346.1 adenylyltransferase/cytidyltransferase family protein [Listeria booriae]MBC1331762.1 adenylyltransferase/cytidyltransferase family protein [Listeria booriae]MBC2366096.1 adenylyltransferase/cytidyltransferase family protein [Listeria booria
MKKYRIGLTTGVFDLFHIGHLNILKNAKSQCDILIVGVSTDEFVQAYKQKTPVIPFEDRKQIVEALKYVDLVVPQTSHESKLQMIDNHNVDVMFHGNDWKGSPTFNKLEAEFKRRDVDIVYFDYTAGVSSTKLVETIQQETVLVVSA